MATASTRPGAAHRRSHHLALVGGTTTAEDCRVALRHLLDSRERIDGPALAEYERAFARTIGVRHASAFSSGRVALYALLRSMRIGRGDEVLLQVPTHIVVANAIRYLGAVPVYVDCRLDTFNMAIEQAQALIGPRTRALVLQHTFGIPAEVHAAVELARANDLILIEDCVHSLGARIGGRPLGSFGRAAFFSTEETKTISTTMGGVAVTDDPRLAESVREIQRGCAPLSSSLTVRYLLKLVSNHALTDPRVHRLARALYESMGEHHPLPGPTVPTELRGERPSNYEQRLSNALAAVGCGQLRRLEANLEHRRRLATAYADALDSRGVPPPPVGPGDQPAYVRYPVWTSDRERAVEALRPYAVPGTWFTSVLEEADSPAFGGYEAGSCPNAELVATHLVNLPTHPRVRISDAERLVAALSDVLVGPGSSAAPPSFRCLREAPRV